MIEIKTPIWKTRSIGIADYKLGTIWTEIKITYKDKYGNLMYPNVFKMLSSKIKTYPRDKKHPFLYVVPINDFQGGSNEI